MMGLAGTLHRARPGGAPPPLLLPGPLPGQPGVRALRLTVRLPARPPAGPDRAAAARPDQRAGRRDRARDRAHRPDRRRRCRHRDHPRSSGQAETITAGYVVGCDGAHSRVRRELGLTFHGHPYPQDWLLADVLLGLGRPARGRGARVLPARRAAGDLLPDARAPVAADAALRRRPRRAGPHPGRRSSELTDQRAPAPVTVSDPTWLANFRCHRRSASAYRRGRVLLAGDAVHIHTPAGGQGLNTGITMRTTWAGSSPWSPPAGLLTRLLDSYGAERRPVAEEVLWLTDALVHYGTISHPVKRRVRDIVVPVLGRSAAHPAPGRPQAQPGLRRLPTRRIGADQRRQWPGQATTRAAHA